MAKYSDYVSNDIESEIGDAQKASNQRARDAETGKFIPDRFKDKDITDVIKSYEELEKLNSRQSQDLGTMRQQVDRLMEMQLQQVNSPAPEPSKPVSVDDLYDDADGVIRSVAKQEVSSEVNDLRQELNQLRLERAMAKLENKFEGWTEKVRTPEFTGWVNESAYRQKMFRDADNGDFDAAEEILGMYYEHSTKEAPVEEEPETVRKRATQLRDAMLETGSPDAADIEETYSRHDLMEARLAAKRGDLKAERWLKSHAASIANAYEEGRIVD